MTNFESELKRRLEDVAKTADPSGAERVLQRVRRTKRNRRRARAAAFSAGVIAAAGLGLALSLNGEGDIGQRNTASQPEQQRQAVPSNVPDSMISGLVEPGEPCNEAKHADSIAELNSNVPVWAPANATLTDAWTCGGVPVLLYGDIQISYQGGWGNIDPEQKITDWAADDGARVETILGRPAEVHPATATGPRNSVLLFVDKTLIVVTAKPGVPIEKLVELTRSIQLPPNLAR